MKNFARKCGKGVNWVAGISLVCGLLYGLAICYAAVIITAQKVVFG